MDADPLIERILNDEGLTDDLDEAEAEAMNGWLIRQARGLARSARTMAEATRHLDATCRQARDIGRVMTAWRDRGDAAGLAKSIGLNWRPGKDAAETLAGLLGQAGPGGTAAGQQGG